MVQVRKLVLAIAAASALSSGMAQALGLGELSVKSTLNQPLVAEIELTEAQGLNATQVVPSLATTADFAQAGVTRQAFLNDLTFTPVINASGKSVLRITSSKPVREPYVKFLVQVLWPNGRLLREYSLLLDPPKFSPEAAAAAAAPAPAPASAAAPAAPAQLAAVAPPVEAAASEAPAPAAPAGATALPPPTADKPAQYVTANNDTLWEIAAKVRTAGTVQQTMLAIQALNPDAFIGGNINRLKKGQVLRLPTPQQTTALPQPQAVTEVSRQYTEWRGGRRSPATGTRQVDATRRDRAGAAPSRVDTPDNLSLVSASGKPAAKGATGDSDLGNKLAVTQEALDTTRRDNAELKSRMNDLQSQLDKLQRLIELKNGQLAKMQAAGAAVPPAAATPDATTPSNAAVPASLVDANGAPVKPAGEVATEDALPAGAAQVATPAADQPLAVEPVAVPEEDDSLQKILDNPVLLGLIGGAVLLILALLLLFLARRRAAKAEAEKHKRMARALAEESDFVSDMDLDTPQASFDGLDVPPPNVRMGAAGAAAAAATRERQADPLVQAEIHIAYGRMNQAVELLEEAVQEDPKRDDIRLKLMEIYAEQGNNKAYAAHERKLVAAGKPEAEVEQLEERHSTLKPAAPLASEPVSTPSAAPAVAAAAAAASAAALAAELDAKYVEELLADNDNPDEPAEQAAVPAPEPVATPEPDEFDHDFDLSLDEFEEASTPEVSTVNDLDDLTLDEPKPDTPQAAAVPDDEALTFESIMQQQEEARAATSTEELADFDLDLSEEDPALKNEDDFLLGLGDDSLDLGKTTPPPVSDDLELPEDFDLSLADEIETDQASQAFASEIDDVNAELDRLAQNLEHPPLDEPRFTAEDAAALDDEPDFDFMSGTDEAATKLDLARAYIDMGDADGARDILDEVVTEGDDGQKNEAREMLSRLV
ncbi:FimV/HubP family polar landmark protein [Pseudomonas cannabina]|nr:MULTISPECIES: FimV/HubP family polar landmark protein [Pseudomonas syringae group]KPW20858.1 Peptidoglycan-binding protein [Pseudomonas cannabina pv. alisalensis]MBM0142192.1 FimV family protein [Pseudomonas cannabina pv. alisalensis]QHE98047.1 tetratricopeptide repeat protein [Pseudomonas syringae pv. maculicola str. ES4326]QQN23747.1 FimV family protein [Pseudomonas cannabina pv. alisalensis]RMN98244.1 Peptidoglycan-binding protein [Pseudomonas cannabina]